MRFGRADGKRRCACRGCSNLVPESRPRSRYCSDSCCTMECRYLRHDRTRPRVGECKNGHVLTPQNTRMITRSTGLQSRECLDCLRARLARRKKNPAYLERQRVYSKAWFEAHREEKLSYNREYKAYMRKLGVKK